MNKLLDDESGQAMAEYMLATVFLGLSAVLIFKFFKDAVKTYTEPFCFITSIPFP